MYQVEKYEIISERNNISIVIFPEIPFWAAVDKKGLQILEFLKNGITLETLSDNSKLSQTECQQFVETLEKSGVVYLNEKTNTVPHTLPDIRPNKVTFLQTIRCNLRCKHCCVADMNTINYKNMDIESAKLALKRCYEIMDSGKKGVSFLGGEPFCGDHFIELLIYASDLGFNVGLSTNATLIDENFAKLAGERNFNVQISLDGIDKKTHESVRGIGTWNKAITAIKLLKKYHVDVQTNFVYHKGNIDEIESYFEFAKEHGIKKARLTSLMNMGRAVGELQRVPIDEFANKMIELVKRRTDLIEYVNETSFMGLILGAKFSQKMISCGAGVIAFTINPDGNVYPCLNLYDKKFEMFNILDDSYKEQFENSLVRKKFKELRVWNLNTKCKTCTYKLFCGGRCRGETYQETKDINKAYPYCEEWKRAMELVLWFLVDNPTFGNVKVNEVKENAMGYIDLWH